MILGFPNLYPVFDEIILHSLAKCPLNIPTIRVCIEGCLWPPAHLPINQLPILHSGHPHWSSHSTPINLCSISLAPSISQLSSRDLPSSFSPSLELFWTFMLIGFQNFSDPQPPLKISFCVSTIWNTSQDQRKTKLGANLHFYRSVLL